MGQWAWVLLTALALSAWGLARHLRALRRSAYRTEIAPPVGSASAGVLYAFTWGMMPWVKESTRLHLAAYLRGVLFHVGIGAGFLALILSPWQQGLAAPLRWAVAAVAFLGAVAGAGGLAARLIEARLRRISTPDDYFSVALVTMFLGAAAGVWAGWLPGTLFYLLGTATLLYIPFGKIRHCFYYFFSRYFFGVAFGRRGVIGWRQVHE